MRSPLVPIGHQFPVAFHDHAWFHLTQGLQHNASIALAQHIDRVLTPGFTPTPVEKGLARLFRKRAALRAGPDALAGVETYTCPICETLQRVGELCDVCRLQTPEVTP